MSKLTILLMLLVSISCQAKEFADDADKGLFDKNGDGVQDIFYEYLNDGSYIELVDSDYDGKVDQSCTYDSNDTIAKCMFDQDKDGVKETTVEYLVGNTLREGVDANNDGQYELIFLYELGVLKEAYRYDEKGNSIGSVSFEFGYPSSEKKVKTELTVESFSKIYWDKAADKN